MSYCPPFEFKVIRGDRRSLSVRISDDNSVVVRCPESLPSDGILKFLERRQAWIARRMAENEQIARKYSSVISGVSVLVNGEELPLTVGARNYIGADGVSVTSPRALKNLLISELGGRFCARVREFARRFAFDCGAISFRSYRGRWGCCDCRNNLTFNYKLLMLPCLLQDYVIAHELCHTRRRDHSPQFKALLKSVFPARDAAEKQLESFSFLARLY